MMKKTREMFVAAANLSLVRTLCGGKIEVYASEDCTIVAGFVGKRAKPSMYYRFSTVEKAGAYADKWVADEAEKIKKSTKVSAKVGDLFVSTWGWEQTAVDFYTVVAVGGSMVSLKKIPANKIYTGSMVGKSFPAIDESAEGAIIRRKLVAGADRASVKINSYAYAYCADLDAIMRNGVSFSEYA